MGETRNNNVGGKTFKSQEEGRGSPAFARDQISVTDDLTLSQTNEEGKSSYRGTGVGIININDQSKKSTPWGSSTNRNRRPRRGAPTRNHQSQMKNYNTSRSNK